jgi:hypothetical protein
MNDEVYILKYINANYVLKVGVFDLICYDKVTKKELSVKNFNTIINNVFGVDKTYDICDKWYEAQKNIICYEINDLLKDVHVELGKTNWVFKTKNGDKFLFKNIENQFSEGFSSFFLRSYYEKWCMDMIEKESSKIINEKY